MKEYEVLYVRDNKWYPLSDIDPEQLQFYSGIRLKEYSAFRDLSNYEKLDLCRAVINKERIQYYSMGEKWVDCEILNDNVELRSSIMYRVIRPAVTRS